MLVIREGQDPVQIGTGNNEFQVCILVGCLLWGASGLLALSKVGTNSTQTIPLWAVYLFFAALAAGSMVTLVGIVYETRYRLLLGFYVERAGLLMLTGLCFCYGVWTGAANGPRATGFVLLMAAVAIASGLRARRITKDLAEVADRCAG